ncbi:MAG: helix-turn-helix domain-containing protein [Armatimonadetes bacterium]|nr:helix-turn-helix domain-containing protein [Armatimonadota bacterium]
MRGTAALTRALVSMPRRVLRDLVRETAEEKILIAAALQPGVLESVSEPLLKARLRGVERKRELLEAEGGTISAEEAGRLLAISRQAVDKARRAGRLLAVNVGRAWRYPVWQFGEDGTLPGLPEVLRALRTASPWVQTAFLLGRNARLRNRRPLDRLRQGKTGEVVAAAEAYGEHGGA